MNVMKTKAQRKREREYEKIMTLYDRLREANPEASDNAIFETIAAKVGWTRMGIFKVVRRLQNPQLA